MKMRPFINKKPQKDFANFAFANGLPQTILPAIVLTLLIMDGVNNGLVQHCRVVGRAIPIIIFSHTVIFHNTDHEAISPK